MTRHADWEERLTAFLEPLRLEPFAWGRHDCCTFAAGAVRAMTGVDPMPEFRGRYTTKRGAAITLGRYGARTLAATMDAKFAAVPPALAQRGDIGMVDGCLGIVFGPVVILVGRHGEADGLIRRDRLDLTHAWTVGGAHG